MFDEHCIIHNQCLIIIMRHLGFIMFEVYNICLEYKICSNIYHNVIYIYNKHKFLSSNKILNGLRK